MLVKRRCSSFLSSREQKGLWYEWEGDARSGKLQTKKILNHVLVQLIRLASPRILFYKIFYFLS